MESLFGPKLLKGSEEVDTSSMKGAVVAVYFSAHWCPPCKAFTPQFTKMYERCKEQGKSFDVVFVSSDHDEAAFREYYRTMPWHALPFLRRDLQMLLGQRFGVKGIPAVILLNVNGTLLDANGRSKVMDTSFPCTLPRVADVGEVLPAPEGPVLVRVLHQRTESEIEVEADEGWEIMKMQIFSVTEVPVEQQRLFGLGTPTGQLSESVSLAQTLARGIREQAGLSCNVVDVPSEARTSTAREWYQLDLGRSHRVLGVELAPGNGTSTLVTKFTVSIAESGEGPWSPVEGGRVMSGCICVRDPPRRVLFSAPVSARFVRVHTCHAAQGLAVDVLVPSGEPQKAPLLVVLSNFSKSDPFEATGAGPSIENKMLQEQHLAFLQVKLSSAPDRLQHQVNNLSHVFKYEDLGLQRQALDQIPVTAMAERVASDAGAEGYELAFMRQFLHWFKFSFFSWTNAPKCEHCSSTDTVSIGGAPPDQIEQSYGAGQVEVGQCKTCGGTTRFPRYNDPGKLLETRQGRCGEWANCFTLCCRALGFEVRHVHDWTDHVWTEIYSDSLGRWVHADSCEAALDCPLVYEQGWGKKLTYCLAFARDSVVDVTRRYTREYPELLTRRTGFTEDQLQRAMSALDEFALERSMGSIPAAVAEARRTALAERARAELTEFQTVPENAPKAGEEIGRTSGDKEWREQRGELGATMEARAKALESSETGVNSKGEKLCIKTTTSSVNDSVVTDVRQLHMTRTVPDGFDHLAIHCRWKDQGFGNQKGRLIVVVKRGTETICEHDCFGPASHAWETKSKTLSSSELRNPCSGDVISIEYVVGGGGGHELHVEDLKISVAGREANAPAASPPSTAGSGGYPTCATPAGTAAPSKEEMQALVKKAFAELVASGVPPNEAAAKAIERAKKEQLAALTKKAFVELVASGVTPNEAAATAVMRAKEQMK